MSSLYKKRINKVRALLKSTGVPSAIILSSAKSATKSGDTTYSYRPDSNLYYLTGSTGKEINLFISTEHRNCFLIVPPEDLHKSAWEGSPPNYRSLAKSIGAELIVTDNASAELRKRLVNHEVLYHQNSNGTLSFHISTELQSIPYFARSKLPASFTHVDHLMQELRAYKDPVELKLIRKAANITNHALFETVPFITPNALECEIASTIDYLFRIQSAEPSFSTIVAAGPSAATLHYEEQNRKVKSNELILLDCGAAYQFYAADITRTLPVSGNFNQQQKELYSGVLEAQEAAIKTARHGVSIKKVHSVAAKLITECLVDVGVLRGKVSQLMNKGAYKPYFMHGIGHSLGLDVHDLGNLRDRGEGTLKAGMVLTIEPGIYFCKKTRHIPTCGIRIEDDILIKRGAPEVLSAGFPKSISEVEDLMNQ